MIYVNGEPTDVREGSTVAALLDTLELPRGRRGLAVAVDAQVVPRGEWGIRVLGAEARVEIVSAIQGG